MSNRHDYIIVATVAVFLSTTSSSIGDSGSNESSCPAQFLQPPTISRDLFVDREIEEDFVQTITAHADYWLYPHIRSFDDGRMDEAARFEMMVDDARSLSEEYNVNSRSPFDFEHFDILVQASTERPIWVHLGGTSEASRENWEVVVLENGIVVEGPGDIEFTGTFLHSFERVIWTSGQRYLHRDDEFFVLHDSAGEISEILICLVDGSVPNPGCDLHFKQEPLWVTLSIRKYLLDELPLIRQHAHQFVRCILQ